MGKKLCNGFAFVCLFSILLSTAPAAFAAVSVTVSPGTAYVAPGYDKQFTLQMSGAATTSAVTWSVNNIPGGDSSVGTVVNGKYVAPMGVPVATQFTVRATSVEDPNAVGSAIVTIVNPSASVSSLNPASVAVGTTFTLQVFGVGFVNGAKINWNGVPQTTTFNTSSFLQATVTASVAGTIAITVSNPISLPSQTLYFNVTGQGGQTPPTPPPPPPPITVTVVPGNAGMQLGGSQQFTATVNNSGNQNVTWKVNGAIGGDPGVGFISPAGLYTSPQNMPSPNVVTVSAVALANGTSTGTATVTIQNPQIVTWARLVDQSTFGPTPALIAHAQQLGVDAYIDEQFSMPESPWPADSGSKSNAIDAFFNNAAAGQDQLRQRTIYALSEIIVIAMNKNVNGDMVIPWLKILSKNAFGNYRTLLRDITLDGGMGHFLDLVNSGGGGAPNENYPREVMQLFSIGLSQLNPDGSVQLDANNVPIPTYNQTDVRELAKALTGWTYNSANGTIGGGGNNAFYPGPMLPMPNRHVGGSKTFLGQTLPAGNTIVQDLDGAIDIIFNHPNVGPFVATRLIRALVTSNPSPAYIAAVAAKFNDNGLGVRGDMKAVLREILTNAEARNDNPAANFGRLRTPMQYLISTSRALNMNIGGASGFNYIMYGMNEGILDAPSVFGHYSPLFRIPKSGGLFGPEFQIYSPSDAVNRANLTYQRLNPYPFNPALSPYINIASNSQALIDAVDNALLYGRMSQTLRNAISNSLSAMPDNNQRAINAIYLTVTSGEYLVQR